jgi:hypothetical protein
LARKPSLKNAFLFVKYYRVWKKHLTTNKNPLKTKIPWVPFETIDYLEQVINSNMTVFEYGSGASTFFWSSRVKQVITVEHDEKWFKVVKEEIDREQIDNVEYKLRIPNAIDRNKLSNNSDYISNYLSFDETYFDFEFASYVSEIDKYPDYFFDIIVIDGRARPSCIKHSLNKVNRNGYLIIDNSDREYYMTPFKFDNKQWKKLVFSGPVPYSADFSETTILRRLS